MLSKYKAFDGTINHLIIEGRLRSCAGNTSCFTEIWPVKFPSSDNIQLILYIT